MRPYSPVEPAAQAFDLPVNEAKPSASAGPNDEMDAKSDGSYDPLFDDEPDTDAPPQIKPEPAAQRPAPSRSDLSLPGSVPQSQFAPRVASNAVPRNAPPVLDPNLYASFSSDVLMTASIDGQIILWDRRANTPGGGVGRMFMDDKTPPWCASVRTRSYYKPHLKLMSV